MPFMECTENGKSGWKYGESGKCYTGEGARARAGKQAAAMHAHGYGKMMTELRKAVVELEKDIAQCPGGRLRAPAGHGRALGRGKGRGPLGRPVKKQDIAPRPDKYPERQGGEPLYAPIEE